jgi:hypothetical protein
MVESAQVMNWPIYILMKFGDPLYVFTEFF